MHYWWLDSVYLFNLQCSEAQWVFLKWWDWRWTGAQSNVNLWLQQSQPKQVPGCGKYIYKYKLLNTNIFLCWLDLVFPTTPLLVHPGCLTLLWMLFFFFPPPYRPPVFTITFLSFVPNVIQPSSSHPLNLSLCPPPPLCPDASSPWRWWTGSAPRGTTGTTTAHRGTMRVMGPPRTWIKTSVSRLDRYKERSVHARNIKAKGNSEFACKWFRYNFCTVSTTMY